MAGAVPEWSHGRRKSAHLAHRAWELDARRVPSNCGALTVVLGVATAILTVAVVVLLGTR
jgi:hypothetical protein